MANDYKDYYKIIRRIMRHFLRHKSENETFTYMETKRRPLYIVAEEKLFNEEGAADGGNGFEACKP